MKTCTKCGQDKPEDGFPKTKAGRRAQCKSCVGASERARRAALSPEAKRAEYERVRAWKRANPDRATEAKRSWREHNRDKVRRMGGLRWTDCRAQPAWASTVALDAIYARALLLTEITGVQHEVDHIVPLKGKNVCGLHVPENLRAIPERENKMKGSKFTA